MVRTLTKSVLTHVIRCKEENDNIKVIDIGDGSYVVEIDEIIELSYDDSDNILTVRSNGVHIDLDVFRREVVIVVEPDEVSIGCCGNTIKLARTPNGNSSN